MDVNIETIPLFACVSAACGLFAKLILRLPQFWHGAGIADNA
jgi:hypothetical protein